MSKFTDFLNLFKWDPIEDADEEFDIDKALNDNWDKIDTKLKAYITDTDNNINDFKTSTTNNIENFKNDTNEEINNFKIEINSNIDTFKEETDETVQNLRDSISETQEFHKYILKITSTIEKGGVITLPFNYKVGSGCLDVYYMGELLTLSSDDAGTDGHYREVGETNAVSNQIKTTTDWEIPVGRYFDFVVRGEYSND